MLYFAQRPLQMPPAFPSLKAGGSGSIWGSCLLQAVVPLSFLDFQDFHTFEDFDTFHQFISSNDPQVRFVLLISLRDSGCGFLEGLPQEWSCVPVSSFAAS